MSHEGPLPSGQLLEVGSRPVSIDIRQSLDEILNVQFEQHFVGERLTAKRSKRMTMARWTVYSFRRRKRKKSILVPMSFYTVGKARSMP